MLREAHMWLRFSVGENVLKSREVEFSRVSLLFSTVLVSEGILSQFGRGSESAVELAKLAQLESMLRLPSAETTKRNAFQVLK